MAAWLATRKVRHLGILQPDGMWVPLCARQYHPLPQTMWLGPKDHSEYISDGNYRRAYRARWRHPICTRCLSELRSMRDLVSTDAVGPTGLVDP